jgi:hypothetical protein
VDDQRGRWTVRCLTTAKDGSGVRLLKHGHVVDRARVRDGSFRLHGRGALRAHVIDIGAGTRLHL